MNNIFLESNNWTQLADLLAAHRRSRDSAAGGSTAIGGGVPMVPQIELTVDVNYEGQEPCEFNVPWDPKLYEDDYEVELHRITEHLDGSKTILFAGVEHYESDGLYIALLKEYHPYLSHLRYFTYSGHIVFYVHKCLTFSLFGQNNTGIRDIIQIHATGRDFMVCSINCARMLHPSWVQDFLRYFPEPEHNSNPIVRYCEYLSAMPSTMAGFITDSVCLKICDMDITRLLLRFQRFKHLTDEEDRLMDILKNRNSKY